MVMPRPGADEGVLQAELNALARTRLAAYKASSPLRNGGEYAALGLTGKILKRDLRALIQRANPGRWFLIAHLRTTAGERGRIL